jgi:hypothetical protein
MSSDYKTIQIRRGLNSEFVDANPILNSGEPAYVIDAKIFKIGDGVTRWNNLSTIANSYTILVLTQQEYDNLSVVDPNTLYFIQ